MEALNKPFCQAYPDLLPSLHSRAITWFERHGFIPEAINHAFASNDFERAATLIEPILYPMFNRCAHATVRYWLRALPEDVLFARPSLCLQYAWAFLYVGEIAACQRPLDVAEQAWRAEGNLPKLGEVHLFRASLAIVQGEALRARDYAQQALALVAEDDRLSSCNAAVYIGASFLMTGEISSAVQVLSEARRPPKSPGARYG